jgi:hypothetical protein
LRRDVFVGERQCSFEIMRALQLEARAHATKIDRLIAV